MRGDSGKKVGQRGQDLQKRTKAVEVRAEGELNSSFNNGFGGLFILLMHTYTAAASLLNGCWSSVLEGQVN